jgi:hypothetical protein
MPRLCRGGKLYLQAPGWRVAKKDRIDLDITRLDDAQGLYTCPPLGEGDKPFSCCLGVKMNTQITHQVPPTSPDQFLCLDVSSPFGRETRCLCNVLPPTISLESIEGANIQVQKHACSSAHSLLQASLSRTAALPEYVLSFHPPLTIRNSIPYEINLTLSEGSTTGGSLGPGACSVTIAPGGMIEVQQYDLSQKIFMSMQLQVAPAGHHS